MPKLHDGASVQRQRCPLRSSLVLAIAFAPLPAWCGAPFATDDPLTVDEGRIELLAFFQSTLQASGRVGSLPGFESHFGLFRGAELDLIAPVAFSAPAGQGAQRGYGDTTIGLKYRIVEESALLPLVSFVPKWVLPTGDASRNLGN